MALFEIISSVGIKTGLGDTGLQQQQIPIAIDLFANVKFDHPRKVTKRDIQEIIGQAFEGKPSSF